MKRIRQATLAIGTGLVLVACANWFEPDRTARAPVLEGFGTLAWKVTTTQPAAQRLFTQAMLQAYAFNEREAVRDFKAALAADPNCAMCAWGVAYALGPNINHTERGDLSDARRHIAYAQRHAAAATPRERGLIEALALRYAEDGKLPAQDAPLAAGSCGAAGQPQAHPLDVAYARKMRALSDAYPDDPEITSFYAEAVIIATPADLWDRKTGAPAPEADEIVRRLESALAKAPEHTGLNHYLIHALDQSPTPQRAEAAADRLGRLAAQSPHLVHMPAHIYVKVARYGDARRVNEEALAAELSQAAQMRAQQFEPVLNWDQHNVHFLWFAALMDGHAELALAQARRLATLAAGRQSAYAEYLRSLPALTLARLGRWNEVLNEPELQGESGVAQGLRDYARGIALLRSGPPDAARAAAAALQQRLDSAATAQARNEFARSALEVLNTSLHAELLAASGDLDGARRGFERAAELEDALEANEPPLLAAHARLALGDALLRAQRAPEAEAAFRSDLTHQPGSGWALRGLHGALLQQGKQAEAAQVQRELARAWPGADAALKPGA
ncbi:MAG TPA: hypothetical protein VJ598_06490 [Albitalea sp.]|nr:hypothetical protein [Albitalea sp.]